MKKLLFLFLILWSFILCSQELPQFFSDNRVLQQNDMVPIWGLDKPRAEIQIITSWGETVSTKADENGNWNTKLKTIQAGGPYHIIINGNKKDTIHNVLLGEVWFASGQSNMHMPLKGYKNTPIDGSLYAIVVGK
jgi:sialate O-acetylesterase